MVEFESSFNIFYKSRYLPIASSVLPQAMWSSKLLGLNFNRDLALQNEPSKTIIELFDMRVTLAKIMNHLVMNHDEFILYLCACNDVFYYLVHFI